MKFYVLSFFIVGICFGQKKVTVYNSETQKPISYANVWKDNIFYGTCDSLGVFAVEAKNANSNFKISAVGFEEKTISASAENIYLLPRTIALKEVILVKNKIQKKESLGKFKRSGSVHAAVQFDAKNALIAKFIPNAKKEVRYLEKVKFFTQASEKNRIISVVFYSVNEKGEPEEILNSGNIVCRLKKGTHLNTVDLTKFDITFPKEGIFVVLQYLLLEQNRNRNKESTHPLAFFYEPCVFVTHVPQHTDTWYLEKDSSWAKNNRYSLNIAIEVTN